jgi:predicted N-acyltransferase
MQITFITHIAQLDAAYWNALCADAYPFARHEFLHALEASGSIGEGTGWLPQHLLVHEGDELIAAMPLYIKSHSYGEYVFDWAWADAYQRHGFNYYPKLINAIPFTPCTGARLLLKNAAQQTELVPQIVAAIKIHAQKIHASSWHCLFPTPALSAQLVDEKLSQRIGVQFHWFNRGYNTWDDFVASMTSRKRKNINKERRQVAEQGIYFVTKAADAISAEDWQLFYRLYCNTYLKRSGHTGYLTEQFFQLLGDVFAKNSLLIIAYRETEAIAAALFFMDAETIYGRYWGCITEYDFLHFETCYYQGIEYAIKHGLQRFDGGAQGEHKIQRGFEPVTTYSNHWLARADFQQAIDSFLVAEKPSVELYREDAKTYLPFKEISN